MSAIEDQRNVIWICIRQNWHLTCCCWSCCTQRALPTQLHCFLKA